MAQKWIKGCSWKFLKHTENFSKSFPVECIFAVAVDI